MAPRPVMEEIASLAPSMGDLVPLPGNVEPLAQIDANGSERRLSIYAASAGFEMVSELDHLSARALTPNIFFNPRFLAPAMPRLEDRDIFLAVLRDEAGQRSRLRFLLPYSIERPAFGVGHSVIRGWSNDFGPLGTPLIDGDHPIDVAETFLAMLTRPSLHLPKVLVLPDIPVDSVAAEVLRAAALSRDLTIIQDSARNRPCLTSTMDSETYLTETISSHHRRNYGRLHRRLEEQGALEFSIARQPAEIRKAMETFLTLELMSWKGRARTAMASDRFQSAFAREAIDRMAERDMVRIHELKLDGETIASTIVLVERGEAVTWKTAYDETLAAFSPGVLLMLRTTEALIDDPNITVTDSCARDDHPVMSRLWKDEIRLATLIIGLTPDADRAARQTARQLHLYKGTRNLARTLRRRVRSLMAH